MQDRLKFRAWDKRSKRMLKVIEIGFMYYDKGDIGHISMEDESSAEGWELLGNPENTVLMQCTGKRDINGKLIYEDDIVRDTKNNAYEDLRLVAYNENLLKFDTIAIDENGVSTARMDLIRNREFEVVGNKYENPELLKGGAKC